MSEIDQALAELERNRTVPRIWDLDHTVWKPDPREIADRLGWLDVTVGMRDQVPALEEFAGEVRDDGIRHVVVLGMGGSSLGAEVLKTTFGSAAGYPELTVLDSVIPEAIRSVTKAVEPDKTLFLVSSKSGSTLEPNVLYRHFRSLVENAVGSDHAGHSFVAVTDEGTAMEDLAHEDGFRAVFLNPSDIGGRYSVLSYYGLVPAALIGADLTALLDRADGMRESCGSDVPLAENPGAHLGAVMGASALNGRDKLTIVTSPAIASFGLWVEQLIAESTGKEGKGLVPVVGEPDPTPATRLSDDRVFVYVRLEGDDNEDTDREIGEIEARSDQTLLRLDLRDRHDIGAEFFRWEFATAVAGSVLDINPFDQPDVQRAKDETAKVLREYQETGRMAAVESESTLDSLLSEVRPGDYFAITAFLPQSPEIDIHLSDLRRRIVQEHGVATTLGYGPRFLHSTGQLHKGGPGSGLFVQFTSEYGDDLAVPGETYSFGVLAEAQAVADLRVLRELGRRAIRVQLGSDYAAELSKIASASRDAS